MASIQGNAQVATLLLEAGAEVDGIGGEDGGGGGGAALQAEAPLLHASQHGSEDVLRLLLSRGVKAR